MTLVHLLFLFQTLVGCFEKWLEELVDRHGIVVPPYAEVSPKELVEQLYAVKKPFKDSGEGHKDYIVWKSILVHLIGKKSEPPNILLTSNTKDFCDTDGDGKH